MNKGRQTVAFAAATISGSPSNWWSTAWSYVDEEQIRSTGSQTRTSQRMLTEEMGSRNHNHLTQQKLQHSNSFGSVTEDSRSLWMIGAEFGNLDLLKFLRKVPIAWGQLLRSRKTIKKMEIMAAENGHINVLRFMELHGIWHASQGGAALRASDEGGHKIELLKVFQLPLAEYPDHANTYEAVQACQPQSKKRNGARKPMLRRGTTMVQHSFLDPTPEANLLANFIVVPTSVAEEVMDGVLEDMVVFTNAFDALDQDSDDESEEDFDEANDMEGLQEYQANRIRASVTGRLFPDILGSFCLEPAGLQIGGFEVLDRQHNRVKDGQGAYCKLHIGEWSRGVYLLTSPQWEITFSRKHFETLNVPDGSKSFAFVLPHESLGFPLGGFIYLDRHNSVLALNRLSTEPSSNVMSCGHSEELPAHVADELWRHAEANPGVVNRCSTSEQVQVQEENGVLPTMGPTQDELPPNETAVTGDESMRFSDVTYPAFKKAGAAKYVFVGPKERLGGFLGNRLGGFMYLFETENEKSARFYPIISAGVEFPEALDIYLESQFLPLQNSAWEDLKSQGKFTVSSPSCSETFRTSIAFSLNNGVLRSANRGFHVPSMADKFVFVYGRIPQHPSEDLQYFPRGGFLYLDENDEPCGSSAISFAPRSLCLEFRPHVVIKDGITEEMKMESVPVTEGNLIQSGAERFLFVGPGEHVPGLSPRDIGQNGGFLYLFKDGRSINRFFPVEDVRNVPPPLIPPPQSLAEEFPDAYRIAFLERRTLDEATLIDRGVKMSTKYEVTLAQEYRRPALIPKVAKKFAFLYGNKDVGFPSGGFLYFNSQDRLVAANALCLRQTAHGLSFGVVEEVNQEAVMKLLDDSEDLIAPVENPFLKSKGAKRYLFLGPNEQIRDDEGEVAFQAGPVGGFAYFFGENIKNISCRFYPIASSGQVCNRAKMTGDMNCSLLPRDVSCEDLQVPETGIFIKTEWFKDQVDTPVQVARIIVPGVTHPVVLHGLAVTPRSQVLESRAAKAIAEVAFGQQAHRLLIDMLMDVLDLVCIIYITEGVRSDTIRDESHQTHFIVCIIFLLLLSCKGISDQVCLYAGYRRRHWGNEFWSGHTALLLGVLVQTFCVCGWITTSMVQGTDTPMDDIRPFLALTGSLRWLRLLYMIRGFETFKLGPRILPIFAALGEVKEFLLINVFFFGASFHASFALSNMKYDASGISNIMFTTYRLNFLADFDVKKDVLLVDNATDDGSDWAVFQYLFFVVFSFVVSISLTNIFIGVMSNAFDFQSERVVELFVRSRARLALEYSLREESHMLFARSCCRRKHEQKHDIGEEQAVTSGRRAHRRTGCFRRCVRSSRNQKKGDYLWLCFRRGEDANDMTGNSENITLRGHISGVGELILKKCADVCDMISKVESTLKHQQHHSQRLMHSPTTEMFSSAGDRVLKRSMTDAEVLEQKSQPLRRMQTVPDPRHETVESDFQLPSASKIHAPPGVASASLTITGSTATVAGAGPPPGNSSSNSNSHTINNAAASSPSSKSVGGHNDPMPFGKTGSDPKEPVHDEAKDWSKRSMKMKKVSKAPKQSQASRGGAGVGYLSSLESTDVETINGINSSNPRSTEGSNPS